MVSIRTPLTSSFILLKLQIAYWDTSTNREPAHHLRLENSKNAGGVLIEKLYKW